MITNDTLMRDATYRETVAAKLLAEAYPDSDLPDDQQIDTAVSFADALIRKLRETAGPEPSGQAPLCKPKNEPLATIGDKVSFSGVMESCDIVGREKTLRFRSRDCVYRIVFFDGDVADGLELGRSYFVEAEIMQTTGGTPFLKATAPPRALP